MPSPSDPQPDIDLSLCEAEPIHRPGRIQFFGFLMAVSADWVITRVSENTGAYIGLEPEDLIGQDLSAVLSRETIHNIRTRMQMLQDPDMVERLFRDRILENLDRDFDISLHVSGATTILEFEPSSDGTQDYAGYVQPMINRVSRPETIEQTCDAAVKAVRALTGFDRVMIYRFREDNSGEVIAEVRNPGMESYLGLRYPASDIPPQARALYLRSTLRIVSDIRAPTAGIVPEFDAAGTPLDLSLSSLRAVSPVHLEYLSNMGVQASMSVSIVLRGRLWGLIACHHSSPRILSFQARSATQMFGQFFALILEKKQNEAWQQSRERAQDVHDRVVARLAEGTSIARQFVELSEMIPQVIPCDGVIGWTEGEFNSAGATPSAAEFEELLPFLQATTSNRIFVTQRLGDLLPDGMTAPAAIAGMMVIPVSRTRPDYIVLVRREVAQTVRWAGAPHKAVTVSDEGTRLSPRTSFAAWQEIVRGQSEPWTESEIRAAESLRVTLTEVILKMSEATLAERTAAHERQEILIAELNHRVRNIFNVIRGIWSQSAAAGNAVDGLTDTVGGRIQALARAYDQVTEVDWRPASLWRLLHTELAAYCTEGDDRLDLAGPDALLLPNAVSAVALVILEDQDAERRQAPRQPAAGLQQSSGLLRRHLQQRGGFLQAEPDEVAQEQRLLLLRRQVGHKGPEPLVGEGQRIPIAVRGSVTGSLRRPVSVEILEHLELRRRGRRAAQRLVGGRTGIGQPKPLLRPDRVDVDGAQKPAQRAHALMIQPLLHSPSHLIRARLRAIEDQDIAAQAIRIAGFCVCDTYVFRAHFGRLRSASSWFG